MQECFGLLEEVKKQPLLWEEMFVYKKEQLDAITVENLFQPVWSEAGSNRHRLELKTQAHWRDLLQDLEGKCIYLIINQAVNLFVLGLFQKNQNSQNNQKTKYPASVLCNITQSSQSVNYTCNGRSHKKQSTENYIK